MATRLFVGALSYNTTDAELAGLFGGIGVVNSVRIITDRDTKTSKGFGFVDMADDEEAQRAIRELNQREFGGRQISVSVAKPMADRNDRPTSGRR